jgi:choloylglycine hydrolase
MKHSCTRQILAASVSATLAFTPLISNACTSFMLKGSDGGSVYGRTMEFGMPLKSELITIPKNYALKGIGVDGQYGSGRGWSAKYAVAGMNPLGLPEIVDGMNEKGLMGVACSIFRIALNTKQLLLLNLPIVLTQFKCLPIR